MQTHSDTVSIVTKTCWQGDEIMELLHILSHIAIIIFISKLKLYIQIKNEYSPTRLSSIADLHLSNKKILWHGQTIVSRSLVQHVININTHDFNFKG